MPAAEPRLFVEGPLAAGRPVALEGARAHYVLHVLRLRPGAHLRLFNGEAGEWRARLAGAGRHRAEADPLERVRPPRAEPGPALAFAPIRKSRLDWLVEKAVELGAAALEPVLTARGVARLENPARLRALAVEAAEQCGRLEVPPLADPRPLAGWLAARPAGRTLLLLDETGAGRPILDAIPRGGAAADGGAAAGCDLLVGPEGGFSPAERAAAVAVPGAVAVDLGPRTLRAETAALAALAAWAAAAGRGPPPG